MYAAESGSGVTLTCQVWRGFDLLRWWGRLLPAVRSFSLWLEHVWRSIWVQELPSPGTQSVHISVRLGNGWHSARVDRASRRADHRRAPLQLRRRVPQPAGHSRRQKRVYTDVAVRGKLAMLTRGRPREQAGEVTPSRRLRQASVPMGHWHQKNRRPQPGRTSCRHNAAHHRRRRPASPPPTACRAASVRGPSR